MIIINQNYVLFDFKDSNGDNLLQIWADRLPMQQRERGRLDSKIDMLKKNGDDLPPGLLQPTKSRHIKEIAVNGQVALRVMLCRGPFQIRTEFTFLFGSVERDRRYVPRNAPELAEQNRNELILDHTRRCKHERFKK